MKKEELEKDLIDIEIKAGKAEYCRNADISATEQAMLTRLFMKLLNDFNESTNKYNKWLIRLTWAIAILTVVMVWKMLTGKG